MQGEGVLLDFYPRPPRGGRLVVQQRAVALKAFLSTPSARRATDLLTVQVVNLDISIHALREEGDSVDFIADKSADISIHALREEGDKVLPVEFSKTSDFYPRPPRGGRPQNSTTTTATSKFLSTPSARRATGCAFSGHRSGTISIHALREEGDFDTIARATYGNISIHALREEGDAGSSPVRPRQSYFYPRPPRGGRPVLFMELLVILHISIHALREEGDP